MRSPSRPLPEVNLWQHPYVDVLDLIPVIERVRSGAVARVMDRSVRKTVLHVTGRIAAKNYVSFGEKAKRRRRQRRAVEPTGLGLTGQYVYFHLKTLASTVLVSTSSKVESKAAPFVVHVDVLTTDGNVVRISASNTLYRRIAATPLAVKLPVRVAAARWTVVALDLKALLRTDAALRHRFRCVRAIKICSSVAVRGVYTSDIAYTPATLPAAMAMPLHGASVPLRADATNFDAHWRSCYDWLCLPSAPPGRAAPAAVRALGVAPAAVPPTPPPAAALALSSVVALAAAVALPPPPSPPPAPRVAQRLGEAAPRRPVAAAGAPRSRAPSAIHLRDIIGFSGGQRSEGDASTVEAAATPGCLWSADGSELIYASDATIVALTFASMSGSEADEDGGGFAKQRFFRGHTAPVSVLARSHDGTLLASAQIGAYPVIRLWDYAASRLVNGGVCVALITAQAQPIVALAFSRMPSEKDCRLAAAGKTEKGRAQLLLWNVSDVWASCATSGKGTTSTVLSYHGTNGMAESKRSASKKVVLLARQTSDIDVQKLCFCPYDNNRIASCGTDSVRLWRVARSKLPSTPFNLKGMGHGVVFTDLAFEATYGGQVLVPHGQSSGPDASLLRRVFVVTNVGTLLQFNYDTLNFQCVYRLHDAAITSIAVNEGFCVTASADQYLRVWPLDFSDFWLEAHHEGAVTCIDISYDGLRIASGCATASIGVLNVASHAYSTVLRSHSAGINDVALGFDVDEGVANRIFATAGDDRTIRVWSLETLDQMYEFDAPGERPQCLAFCPVDNESSVRQPITLVVGFDSGVVRIFDVLATAVLVELRQHRSRVAGVAFAPDGSRFYSSGDDGFICAYQRQRGWQPVLTAAHELPAPPSASLSQMLPMPSSHFALSRDGKLLAVSISVATENTGGHFSVGGAGTEATATADDGTLLMQHHNTNFLQIYEANTLQPLVRLWPPASVAELARPESMWAMPANQRTKHAQPPPPPAATAFVFTPDSSAVIVATAHSGSYGGGRRLLRFRFAQSGSGEEWHSALEGEIFNAHTARITSLAVSPDSKLLAVGCADGVIKVWDALCRHRDAQLFVSHCAAVSSMAWTELGDRLVSVDADCALNVWQATPWSREHGEESLVLAVRDIVEIGSEDGNEEEEEQSSITANVPATAAEVETDASRWLVPASYAAPESAASDVTDDTVEAVEEDDDDDDYDDGEEIFPESSSPLRRESEVRSALAYDVAEIMQISPLQASSIKDHNQVLEMEEALAKQLHVWDGLKRHDLHRAQHSDVESTVPPMPFVLTSCGLLGYDGGAPCFGSESAPVHGGAWAQNLVWHPQRAMLAYCSAGVVVVDHLGRKPLTNERPSASPPAVAGGAISFSNEAHTTAVAPMRQQQRFAIHTQHQTIAVLAVSADGLLLATVAWLPVRIPSADPAEVGQGLHGVWELCVFESETGHVLMRRALPAPVDIMRIGAEGKDLGVTESEAERSARYRDVHLDGRIMLAFNPTSRRLLIAMPGGVIIWDGGACAKGMGAGADFAAVRRAQSGMSRHIASKRATADRRVSTLRAHTWNLTPSEGASSAASMLDSEFDEVTGCCWATPQTALTVRAGDSHLLLWRWKGSLHDAAQHNFSDCTAIQLPTRTHFTRITALAASVRLKSHARLSDTPSSVLVAVGLSDGRVWLLSEPNGVMLARWAPPGCSLSGPGEGLYTDEMRRRCVERRRIACSFETTFAHHSIPSFVLPPRVFSLSLSLSLSVFLSLSPRYTI